MSSARWHDVIAGKIRPSHSLTVQDPLIRHRAELSQDRDAGRESLRGAILRDGIPQDPTLGAEIQRDGFLRDGIPQYWIPRDGIHERRVQSSPGRDGFPPRTARESREATAEWSRVMAHIPEEAHLNGVGTSWLWGAERWVGACYDQTKDVVAPPDFIFTAEEAVKSRDAARVALGRDCSRAHHVTHHGAHLGRGGGHGERSSDHGGERPILLFLSGSKSQAAPW